MCGAVSRVLLGVMSLRLFEKLVGTWQFSAHGPRLRLNGAASSVGRDVWHACLRTDFLAHYRLNPPYSLLKRLYNFEELRKVRGKIILINNVWKLSNW